MDRKRWDETKKPTVCWRGYCTQNLCDTKRSVIKEIAVKIDNNPRVKEINFGLCQRLCSISKSIRRTRTFMQREFKNLRNGCFKWFFRGKFVRGWFWLTFVIAIKKIISENCQKCYFLILKEVKEVFIIITRSKVSEIIQSKVPGLFWSQ